MSDISKEQATFNAFLERYSEICYNSMISRGAWFRDLWERRAKIDESCGYIPLGQPIPIEAMRDMYDRFPIANRVVSCLPKESWQVQPHILENEDRELTEFEQAFQDLQSGLNGDNSYYNDVLGSALWEFVARGDELSGIGTFGIILLGLADGRLLEQPVAGSPPDGNPFTIPNIASAGMPSTARTIPGVFGSPNQGPTLGPGTAQQTVKSIYGQPTSELSPESSIMDAYASASRDIYGGATQNPVSSVLGTDAQYRGIQFTPGFYPSGDPYGPINPYAMPGMPPQQAVGGVTGRGNYYQGGNGNGNGRNGKNSKKSQQGTYIGGANGPLNKLLFLRVFDESLVQVVQYEADLRNPRFGRPIMYLVTLNDPRYPHTGIGLPLATLRVHWSRVIHLADNIKSSEIFGLPRMQPVFNRIIDLRKLYGGSAEMYWQGALPGISFETQPQLGGDAIVDVPALKKMIHEYVEGLERYIHLQGLTARTLAPTVVSPTDQIETQIQAICIQLGIPIRVFKGSERGEMASSQDDASWNDKLRLRQNLYISPRVIAPLIDRLITLGVLPKPEKYKIKWPDLDSQTDAAKAAIAAQRTQALSAFTSGNPESVMTPTRYYTDVWGLELEKAEQIVEEAVEAQEQQMMASTASGGLETPSALQQQQIEAQQQQQAQEQQSQQQEASTTDQEKKRGEQPEEEEEGNEEKAKKNKAKKKPKKGKATHNMYDGSALVKSFQRLGKLLAQHEDPSPMPGYGQIFINDRDDGGKEAQVWYVGGDGDEDGFHKVVEREVRKVFPGVSKVIYEAEAFPKRDEGWVQVYPKYKKWVTNNTTNSDPSHLPRHQIDTSNISESGLAKLGTGGIESQRHLLHVLGAPVHLPISLHSVYPTRKGIGTIIESPHYYIERTLDPKERIVHNDWTIVHNKGGGLGTQIFAAQVHHLSNLGWKAIHNNAARWTTTGEQLNGYSTWPKLGYNGTFSDAERRKMPEEYQHVKTIQQLYREPHGREWWEEHGWGKNLEFKLGRNTTSRRVLNAYLKARARKLTGNMYMNEEEENNYEMPEHRIDEIHLEPWEKDALEEAWKELENEKIEEEEPFTENTTSFRKESHLESDSNNDTLILPQATLDGIKEAGRVLSSSENAMPMYGQIFYSNYGTIWYVSGTEGNPKLYKKVMSALTPYSKRITYKTLEYPPVDGSWWMVYPRYKKWDGNVQNVHNSEEDISDTGTVPSTSLTGLLTPHMEHWPMSDLGEDVGSGFGYHRALYHMKTGKHGLIDAIEKEGYSRLHRSHDTLHVETHHSNLDKVRRWVNQNVDPRHIRTVEYLLAPKGIRVTDRIGEETNNQQQIGYGPERALLNEIQKVGRSLQHSSPNYGQIFSGPNGQLWYTGDDVRLTKIARDKLHPLSKGEIIYQAAMFPPQDGRWYMLYPEYKKWGGESTKNVGTANAEGESKIIRPTLYKGPLGDGSHTTENEEGNEESTDITENEELDIYHKKPSGETLHFTVYRNPSTTHLHRMINSDPSRVARAVIHPTTGDAYVWTESGERGKALLHERAALSLGLPENYRGLNLQKYDTSPNSKIHMSSSMSDVKDPDTLTHLQNFANKHAPHIESHIKGVSTPTENKKSPIVAGLAVVAKDTGRVLLLQRKLKEEGQRSTVDNVNPQQMREGFRKAILENPTDPTHHLIYADWLEEHNHLEEAERRRATGYALLSAKRADESSRRAARRGGLSIGGLRRMASEEALLTSHMAAGRPLSEVGEIHDWTRQAFTGLPEQGHPVSEEGMHRTAAHYHATAAKRHEDAVTTEYRHPIPVEARQAHTEAALAHREAQRQHWRAAGETGPVPPDSIVHPFHL